MNKQKKSELMPRDTLSIDEYYFEIKELSFWTLQRDFRKVASFWTQV